MLSKRVKVKSHEYIFKINVHVGNILAAYICHRVAMRSVTLDRVPGNVRSMGQDHPVLVKDTIRAQAEIKEHRFFSSSPYS